MNMKSQDKNLAEIQAQWVTVRGRIRQKIGDAQFKSWIKVLVFEDYDDQKVTLSVSSNFVRTRIIEQYLEIIKRCREEVGEDFPISVKMNSADFQKGGFAADDSIIVAKMLESAGVDIIEISGGTYEQPKLIGVDDLTINPERSEQRKESTIAREAYFLEYAKDIRKAVSLPLMVTGGFRTKEGIEDALKSNICQIIGIGRPLCADPYCVKKMIAGELKILPSFEKTLSLGPSILSPSSPFTIIKAINAFGAMAWFYQQIKNMAKGLMPNHKQKLFNAFRADMKADKIALKDYLDH